MGKTVDYTVTKAERAVETVLNNELPIPKCPREKVVIKALREKVKQELAVKLVVVGPTQMK